MIILDGFGIEGAGAGSLGIAEIRALADSFMRQHDANELVVNGGPRGSGMGPPGRIPRRLRFRLR